MQKHGSETIAFERRIIGYSPLDFHLIFPDWYEQDVTAFICRDRNHPSVISWSFGNEVGEQYTDVEGAKMAKALHDIVKEEDPTRPSTASMNFAKPDMPFSEQMDIIGLNYQGERIINAPAYKCLKGTNTHPLYIDLHKKYPSKFIFSSETGSALSTGGTYLFPVYKGNSAPVKDGSGGDPVAKSVSAYELYTAPFGSSADKVFTSQDQNPYVAGEFVWSGQIVATDNGNPADMVAFPSTERNAFSGLCLVIVKANEGETGTIKLLAESDDLKSVEVSIQTIP